MTRNQKVIFAIILVVAAFLIFFRLGRQDMLGDDAHYSLRAYGYLDYMASQKQTTPLQWFGERPGWSYLSFHDHPPVYFFIQHIFFKLFGDSVVVSRLTSALAALGSVLVIFFIGKHLGSVRLGLAAMVALVLNNFFILNGRIAHIESLLIFWFLLGLLFLLRALQDSPRDFKWAGLFFGLALLTKVSLLFMLPALLLYFVWQRRDVLQKKEFWLGLAIFVLASSPLLFYNLKMYQARGHFDVQFADLFGQSNRDWFNLDGRVGGFHLAVRDTLAYFYRGMSWPYFVAALGALLFAVWQGKKNPLWWLVVLGAVLTAMFLMYVGGASRWLAIVTPFTALALGGLIDFLWDTKRLPIAFASGALAVYSLVFIFNSNHALAASRNEFLTSALRLENYGYNQLDKWVDRLLAGKTVPLQTRDAVSYMWFLGIEQDALPFLRDKTESGNYNSLIIYDDAMNWFPAIWALGRHRIYDGVPSMTTTEFEDWISNAEALKFLNSLDFDRFYFIRASEALRQNEPEGRKPAEPLELMYKDQSVKPEVIHNLQGDEAFYIYETEEIRL
ncbi:MAG: glycosyltransferase family 39 protein [Candidatus Doudnabacteria bacterium]|nr:glycosyltransferase family 39 protein [Candidatus Doudnabacteria bacterium]